MTLPGKNDPAFAVVEVDHFPNLEPAELSLTLLSSGGIISPFFYAGVLQPYCVQGAKALFRDSSSTGAFDATLTPQAYECAVGATHHSGSSFEQSFWQNRRSSVLIERWFSAIHPTPLSEVVIPAGSCFVQFVLDALRDFESLVAGVDYTANPGQIHSIAVGDPDTATCYINLAGAALAKHAALSRFQVVGADHLVGLHRDAPRLGQLLRSLDCASKNDLRGAYLFYARANKLSDANTAQAVTQIKVAAAPSYAAGNCAKDGTMSASQIAAYCQRLREELGTIHGL